MKKVIVFLGLLVFLTSCVPTKQFCVYTHNSMLDNSKGRIYVMRPSSMVGSAVKTSIFCDGVLIGNTGNGSYLCWDMPSGMCRIATTQHKHQTTALGTAGEEEVFVVKVTPGKTYYIRQYPRYGGFSFELMSVADGEKAIKKKKAPKVNYVE